MGERVKNRGIGRETQREGREGGKVGGREGGRKGGREEGRKGGREEGRGREELLLSATGFGFRVESLGLRV
jgi:hypothetical protein